MKTPKPHGEVLFATANEARSDFTVFSEECLRDLAANDSRCRYDENTRQLWMIADTEAATGPVSEAQAERARIAHFLWAVFEASTHGASGLMERAIVAVESNDMSDPVRTAAPYNSTTKAEGS